MSKPMLLDFNDFDCCDQNDDETTLKHRNDGHKIILSHASLPDDAVQNLKAMPKMLAEGGDAGGKAPVPSQDNSQGPSDMKRTLHDVGTAASGGTNKPTLDPRSWWADGGKVDKKENTLDYKEITNRKKQMNHEEASKPPMPRKRFAEGGSAGLPCLNPHCKSHGRPHKNCLCYGPGGPSSENYAEGGEVEPQIAYCAYGFPHHAGCEFAKGGKVEKKEGMSVQGHDVRHGDMHMAKEEAQGRAREERHVRPQMQGLAQGGNVQRYADGTGNVEDIQMPEEQIQGQAPQAVPAQEQPYQPQTTAFPEAAPGAMQTVSPNNSMVQADQQLAQEKSLGDHEGDEDQKNAYDLANGHITPKTYSDLYADKSTGGKMATLFGMLASGFGSGLSHQPNAVLAMMDNVLNKDFEARKESKKNQMNLWDLNFRHAQEQAQAHNLDMNSNYVQEQTKDLADSRTQTQMGRAEYQKMADLVNNMPDGPQKAAYSQALSTAGQAMNSRNLTIRQKLDALVRLQNRGHGLPDNTSIFNPHPSMIKPGAPQGSAPGKGASAQPQQRMGPDDPKWGDNDVRANGGEDEGDSRKNGGFMDRINELGDRANKKMDARGMPQATAKDIPVPKTNAPELIQPNMDEYKRQSFLMNQKDEKGRPINPNIMTDDEKPRIIDALDGVTKYNRAMSEVHKQFPVMWKNAGAANDAIQWLGKQHLWGTSAPDMSSWNDASRKYWQAASAIKKVMGNAAKGGPSEALYDAIEKQLPHNKSTGSDYRRGIDNVGSTMRSTLDLPLLQTRGMIGKVPD